MSDSTRFKEAKEKWRVLVKLYHPDSSGGSERAKKEGKNFSEMSAAWGRVAPYLEENQNSQSGSPSTAEKDKKGSESSDNKREEEPNAEENRQAENSNSKPKRVSTGVFENPSEEDIEDVEKLLIKSAKVCAPRYSYLVTFAQIAGALDRNINSNDKDENRFNGDYIRACLFAQKDRPGVEINETFFYPIFMLSISDRPSTKECLTRFLQARGVILDSSAPNFREFIEKEQRRIRFYVGGYREGS